MTFTPIYKLYLFIHKLSFPNYLVNYAFHLHLMSKFIKCVNKRKYDFRTEFGNTAVTSKECDLVCL